MVNVNVQEKRREKAFIEEAKINNSRPTNSTPPTLSRISLPNDTTQIIVAKQTFDEDQILSILWTRTYTK